MTSFFTSWYSRGKDACAAYESRTIFIRISWNVFTKPRRITRQVLIKTSVASALVAVLAFVVIYTAIIIATTSHDGDIIRTNQWDSRDSHPRFKLLWSAKGRSRFQGRYSPEADTFRGSSLPSRNWGYNELVSGNVILPSCPSDLLLLTIITSAPKNRKQRDVIRNTWCAPPKSKDDAARRKCVFLIGKLKNDHVNTAVWREAEQYGDILLGNYTDSYRNLTYKVISGFHWTVYECKPKFILKTDDDCFVNINILSQFLARFPEKDVSRLYVGNVFRENKDLKVIRDPISKWAVLQDDYAPEYYPKYASGTGYLLSNQVAEKILEISRTYKPFPNEDAYIGVLAESLGISPVHTPRFTLINTQWTTCNFLYLMVVHHVSLQQQRQLTNKAELAQDQCRNQGFFDKWS